MNETSYMALLDIRLSEIRSIEQSVAKDALMTNNAQTFDNEFEDRSTCLKDSACFSSSSHISYEQATKFKNVNIKNV